MRLSLIAPIALFSLAIMTSCDKSEPTLPKDASSRTVLIYAVASNSLSKDLKYDKEEMIAGAPDVAGLDGNVRVLVYEVPNTASQTATLSELKKNKNREWEFSVIKEYDRLTFSTDPERMKQVFSDVRTLSPTEHYGLVFWSHGTGWIPDFTSHQVVLNAPKRSFGYDKYYGVVDKCDIAEMAYAIPTGMFDYIWFDCCYMMCIETAYQLRDKCDYVCGYPTEDWDTGMNYDSTLKYLAAPNADLKSAAESFFDYYQKQGVAATVTVAATADLEILASVTRKIYRNGDKPSVNLLQNYSRLGYGLYDFGQYTKLYFKETEDVEDLTTLFDMLMKKVVVYGNCSDIDFNRQPLDPSVYSGFSCHYTGLDTTNAQELYYYNSLDWPKAVY